jgi:hypothetical protein
MPGAHARLCAPLSQVSVLDDLVDASSRTRRRTRARVRDAARQVELKALLIGDRAVYRRIQTRRNCVALPVPLMRSSLTMFWANVERTEPPTVPVGDLIADDREAGE